ncbi:hypothetical protein CHU98_g3388 [Xylaria longipes]|nr:hypothetical protein CHU98_g3388 [Xylaria longipes]
MAAPKDRPYRHRGVYIPFAEADDGKIQWSSNDDIQKDGFILINSIKNTIFMLQSVRTGDLFVNKVEAPGGDRGDGIVPNREVPPDLRISNAPGADGPLIGPLEVEGRMRIYFSEVVLWQCIGPNTYSIYFKYYNGAALTSLFYTYQNELRPVPESFIWHVFLTLIEAVRYLHRGVRPGTDDEPDEWTPLYHRDIAMNNVFLHYPERPDSEPCPQMGFEENAFPEVIVGDLGDGGIEGDDPDSYKGGRWNSDTLEEWQDTYAIFSVVKELCMAHIHWRITHKDFIPEGVDCDDINGYMEQGHVPYSDDLFNMLKLWEFENCKDSSIDETQPDEDGEEVPNIDRVPDLNEIVETVLPVARRMVRRFRTPGGNVPPDYYRQIDVSWSKPKRLMPYEWVRLHPRDGMPSRMNGDDENNDSENNGSGDGGGNGNGGDGSGVTNDSNVHDNSNQGSNNQNNVQNDSNSDGDNQNNGNQNNDKDQSEVANYFNIIQDKSGVANYFDVQGGGNQDGGNPDDSNQNNGNDSTIIQDEGGDPMDVDDQGNNNNDSDIEMGEGDEDQDSEDGDNGGSSVSSFDNHRCPEPNPESIRAMLNPLINLEGRYPAFRPKHRVVMLHYRRPLMLQVKRAPDKPLHGIPDSPAPSPPPSPPPSSPLSSLDSPSTPSNYKTVPGPETASSSLSSLDSPSTPSQYKTVPGSAAASSSLSSLDSPSTPSQYKTAPQPSQSSNQDDNDDDGDSNSDGDDDDNSGDNGNGNNDGDDDRNSDGDGDGDGDGDSDGDNRPICLLAKSSSPHSASSAAVSNIM